MSADVFISHSTADREVANLLCQQLEADGITCWIAPRNIEGGEAWDEAIIRGIAHARMLMLMSSHVSNESDHVKKELLYAQGKRKPILPVRIEDTAVGPGLEYILTGIQWFNAFPPPIDSFFPEIKKQVHRILSNNPAAQQKNESSSGNAKTTPVVSPVLDVPAPKQPTPPAVPDAAKSGAGTIALLYKRNVQPDGYLLELLERSLSDAGYKVFVDRNMQIGVEWAHEIERSIREAEAVIPLLSEASKESEMLSYEVEIANSASRSQNGKPKLLPVRVGYTGSLGVSLDAILNPLQYALWKDRQDDEPIVKQLLVALKEQKDPDPDAFKEQSTGAIPPGSKFYIARPSDEALNHALARKDTIVLVKGGRQMGKTSLVARGLQQVRSSGATAVYTDLQKLDAGNLAGIQPFYFSLARMLADTLDIDVDIEETWKNHRAPSVNFEQYLKKQVMPKVPGHLFWALDEVDRLFTTDFGSDVFGLFRSWHNERATNPDTSLNHLTLIIAYATEAHLFIADPNQSPFNVGTRLELRDFTLEQEEALNQLFGNPLLNAEQVTEFSNLVSGQPYLTKRGLHDLATTQIPFEKFVTTANYDEGPFGDHLRRILVMLCRDPKMIDAVRAVLNGTNDLTMESFYRLRAAGIVVGEGVSSVRMRNLLYTNYLRDHLAVSA